MAILELATTKILVGMEFLKRFKKTLVMHRGLLVLIDEAEIDKNLTEAMNEAQQAAPSIPTSEPPRDLSSSSS